jgi:hypothetical protein
MPQRLCPPGRCPQPLLGTSGVHAIQPCGPGAPGRAAAYGFRRYREAVAATLHWTGTSADIRWWVPPASGALAWIASVGVPPFPAAHSTVPTSGAVRMHLPNAEPRHIGVIGASLGGAAALRSVVSVLPPDLDAAVLVVSHARIGRLRRAGLNAEESERLYERLVDSVASLVQYLSVEASIPERRRGRPPTNTDI